MDVDNFKAIGLEFSIDGFPEMVKIIGVHEDGSQAAFNAIKNIVATGYFLAGDTNLKGTGRD